jgi:hypothetical protein
MPGDLKISSPLLAARDLPDRINKAVQLAEERLGIVNSSPHLVIRWDLVGRILRDRIKAESFAEEVSVQLREQGLKVEPAVLIINKKIIAGFFERASVPQIRQF